MSIDRMHLKIPLAVAALASALAIAPDARAQTCIIDFTVEITQGVGTIRPGTEIAGQAEYTETGQTFRQEGGATAHMARGRMTLGDQIGGPIWTLITSSESASADLVGIYARDIEGLSFAGVAFEGPMILTLFGRPGTREGQVAPSTQAEWDDLTLRRAFSLYAHGQDMLAGDVTRLTAHCV